jgi:hypothetical protein
MSEWIEQLKAAKKHTELQICATQAANVAKRVCKLFPRIKNVQPLITHISTGMGAWWFNGKMIAKFDDNGEDVEMEADLLADYLRNFNGHVHVITANVNEALYEIIELMDYLCDVGDLNCSTWQNGFSESGVTFTYSEIENKNGNPFSIPTQGYHINTPYYKELVRHKCDINWKIENNKV